MKNKIEKGLSISELNRACVTGEHWMVFEHRRYKGVLSCACGRLQIPRPIRGFIPQKPRAIYQVPTNIDGVPCNFGTRFHERAVKNFLRKKRSTRAMQVLDKIQRN